MEIDSSKINCFLECKRLFDYKYIKNLRGTGRNLAIEFGSAFHSALDNWFHSRDWKEAWDVFCLEYNQPQEEQIKTQAMAGILLKEYHSQYKDMDMKVLETEVAFRMPLNVLENYSSLPDGYPLVGRIDKVVEWEGRVYGIDHKTTSRMGYSFFNKFNPSIQMDIYNYVLNKKFGGRYEGIIIDGIQVAKSKKEMFRQIVKRTEKERGMFLEVLRDILWDMDRALKTPCFYPNYTGCSNWGSCEFRGVCTEGEIEMRKVILREDFRIEKWDPLEGARTVWEIR